MRRKIHTIPKAVIKQNAPPTAAPIIMLRFALTDSLPELELKLFALIVLDAVISSTVSSRNHVHRGKYMREKLENCILELLRELG